MKSLRSLIFCLTSWLLLNNPANAILIHSNAFIDLTRIQVIPQTSGVTLSFAPSFNWAETQVNSDVDWQFGPDGALSDLSSASGFVQALALADAELSAALTSAADEAGYAGAYAWHELQYRASGTGRVQVKVDYQIDQGVLDFSAAWDGFLYALVELLDEFSGTAVFDELFYDLRAGDGSAGRSGGLSLTLDVQDGQSGYLLFTALSEAVTQSVPLPSTVLLIMPFLLGLITRAAKEV